MMSLKLDQISTGYGKKQIIYDFSHNFEIGKLTTIIGPNGSGKSTILKSIIGVLEAWSGEISFNGVSINDLPTANRINMGIAYCPQGERVFSTMSVLDNLKIGNYKLRKREFETRKDEIIKLFPILKDKLDRISGLLSGGEQQVLSIARSMMSEPKILVLDEPTLGLSPSIINDILDHLRTLVENKNLGIIMVEQRVKEALAISDYAIGLKSGKKVFEGEPILLSKDKVELKKIFL